MGSEDNAVNPVDRFTLLEVLGAGSFGEVWRAFDQAKGKDVAVKVVELEDM